jgi:hypothetical protein
MPPPVTHRDACWGPPMTAPGLENLLMRSLRLLVLLVLGLLLFGASAHAYVPQTITVDGVNDFDPSNMVDNDTGDTQTGCTPAALPMDLGKVFMTNDNSFLYIGIEFAKTCYCDMNLGLSLDVGNTVGGGPTDPFGRKIGWNVVTNKPDFVVYDVTPTTCNTFNYEVLYKWNSGTSVWDNISTQVNPAYGGGSNGLGIVDSVTFKEMKIPLSVLGASAGNAINLEVWVTQEGATKGPLDAMCSDNVQMSRAIGTTYDTTAVVDMTCQAPYTVLTLTDITPPTVSSASVVNFPLLPNRQFGLSSNKIDVVLSEPLDLTSAQTASNYTISGAATPIVILAQRDATVPSVVHLTVSSSLSANANFYNVTVRNVKDQANNAIVDNGTTNVGSFFIQNIAFQGNMKVGLCKGIFAPADTFAVEGNLAPLTFTARDNALMYDADNDSIYTVTVPFALPKSGSTAEADLAWKFSRKQVTGGTEEFEPLPGNRQYHISSANGATVTLAAFWNNDDPANFTTHPIDVNFRVDATRRSPTPATVITLLGGEFPLSFTPPGITMRDDGVSPDVTAGDKIYTARVRFPGCANKNVEWKVQVDGTFECATQGNRRFTMVDAASDTVGSPKGPLTLAARGIDRCDVTDKIVRVVYKVNMRGVTPIPGTGDTVAVMGGQPPLGFGLPPVAAEIMADNGVSPDYQSNDKIFAKVVTYPDSTSLAISYKYWYNRILTNNGFECESFGDRTFTLDDVTYSLANPFVHTLDIFNGCANPLLDVGPESSGPVDFAALGQNVPNPAFAGSTIRFQLRQAGRVSLRVYDVGGRHVASLVDGDLTAGYHEARWSGRDDTGRPAGNGVYLYELSQGGQRLAKRMIVIQR